MSRREALNEPAPQRRNPRRFVGESYRDCVDRLAGELTAAEIDRDALKSQLGQELAHQKQAAIDYSNVVGPMVRERDALKARVAELEGALRLTSALVGDGEDARNALKIVSGAEIDALKARVDLLTTALTDAVEALSWASDYIAVNWPPPYRIENFRAVLAATPKENAVALEVDPEAPSQVVADVDERRDPACVRAWPGCYSGGYDPACCRFPKSCSC